MWSGERKINRVCRNSSLGNLGLKVIIKITIQNLKSLRRQILFYSYYTVRGLKIFGPNHKAHTLAVKILKLKNFFWVKFKS